MNLTVFLISSELQLHQINFELSSLVFARDVRPNMVWQVLRRSLKNVLNFAPLTSHSILTEYWIGAENNLWKILSHSFIIKLKFTPSLKPFSLKHWNYVSSLNLSFPYKISVPPCRNRLSSTRWLNRWQSRVNTSSLHVHNTGFTITIFDISIMFDCIAGPKPG